MGGGYAWVTLATNDSYSLGSLVLAHSLKQVGTKQQLAVLITPGVTNSMRSKLNEVFNVVKEVNILDSKDEANLRLLKRPELGITFTKLHCWRLTQFEKCVFLDADTLILENCDELFEREELSAAPDIGWPDCFNSGVFVYRPSNETYEKLIQFALEKGSFDGGDQGLLNLYFSDWAHKDISKHLPFIYNLASTACYSYLPAFKQFGKNAKIIHFIGASKPWLQYFNTETRKVHPSEGLQHLEIILQRWWDIFCNLIHPALTPDMTSHRHTVHGSQSYTSQSDSHTSYYYDHEHNPSVQNPQNAEDFQNVWDPWEEYDSRQSGNIVPQNITHEESHSQHYGQSHSSNFEQTHHSDHGHDTHIHQSDHFKQTHHYDHGHDSHIHQNDHFKHTPSHLSDHHQTAQNIDHSHHEQSHTHSHYVQPVYTENKPSETHFPDQSSCSSYVEYRPPEIYHSENKPSESHYHHSVDHTPSEHHPHHHYEQKHESSHNYEHHTDRRESSSQNQQNLIESHNTNTFSRADHNVHIHHPLIPTSSQPHSPNIHHQPPTSDYSSDHPPPNDPRLPDECVATTTVSNEITLQSDSNEENSDNQAGLAGAFANLTLGQPRTPEQQALDDHLRRQGWEVGNIDYLGRDSFDNIWSKICETLALAPDAAPTVEQPQEAAPVVLSATVEVSDSPQSKTEPPAEAIPSPQTPQPVPSESKDPLPTEAAPKVPPIQSIPEQPVSQKPVVEIPSAGTAPPEAVASQQESPKSETPIQQPTPSEQESQQVPVETNQSVQPSEVKEPATGAPSPAAKTIEPVSTEPPKEEPTVVSESPKQVSETPQADLPKAADSSKESTDTLTAQSVSEKPPTEPVTVVSQSPEKPEDQKPTIEDLKSPEVVSDSPQVPTQEPVKEASKDSTQEVQQETPKSPKEDQKVTPAESPKEPQKEILTQAPAEAQKEVPKVQQKEPVEAPKESPKEAQKEAPKESPKETTKEPPKEAPKESPKEAPKESPKEAPKESPKEAPKESPKEAPKVPPAQKEAPKESPKGAQKEAPKQSPKEAQKETSKEVQKPKESSEKSPKESPKELEKPSPKQTSTPKQSPVSKKGKKDPPKEESKQKETAELPSSKVTEPTPPTTPVSPPVSQEPSSPSPVSKAELQVSASVPETPPPAPSSEAAKGPTPPPRKSGGGKKK
ncbi:unnamed protein product [Diabrotica balteata]|uniref:glycogenin glucosyltransferase n=1 Tax=Diabrotica balteata TaxID=107213 RepID=A0A9P0DWF2_DIABA|nr:unnamed protein product [Diabrotica balteata]